MSNTNTASPSRARPQLSNFSNRSYTASPLGPRSRLSSPQPPPQSSSKRQHIHQSSASRKLMTREEFALGALNASNALRLMEAGSPARGASAASNIFAPGASPAARKGRDLSTASPSPSRSRTSRSAPLELFVQRIPDPPPDLTGEALAQSIPRHLEARGSVYADQYLSHLVPQGFNDEQRRQFFAILDLRRLKVAATEIFAKKDWKINIMSFAREFEKSRSMILLRYGLYEFRNVKPSAEVLRRWRNAHGLPDPVDDDDGAAAGFSTSTKRKAEDQLTKDSIFAPGGSPSKRRAFAVDESSDLDKGLSKSIGTGSDKRKTYASDDVSDSDLPSKLRKSISSTTKSLFQSVADNSGTFRTPDFDSPPLPDEPGTAPVAKTRPLADEKPTNLFASSLKKGPATSIFDHLKPNTPLSKGSSSTGNIFGHLSDSSAKNSFADADTSEDEEEQETPAPAKKAKVETKATTTPANGLFSANSSTGGLFGATTSFNNSVSQDSTSGRSLFDRVGELPKKQATNGTSEKAVENAADKPAEKSAEKLTPKTAPTDQTWSAGTPIKFAPAVTGLTPNGLGAATAQPAQDTTTAYQAPTPAPFTFASKPTTGLFGTAAPSTPQPAPSSLFGQGNTANPPKSAPPKPSTGLFGGTAPAEEPAPAEDTKADTKADTQAPILVFSHPPSTIFGAADTSNKDKAGLFQGAYTPPSSQLEDKPAASSTPVAATPEKKPEPVQAAQPPPSAIFGSSLPTTTAAGLFQGSYKLPTETTTSATSAPSATAPTTAPSASTSIFGASKPTETAPTTTSIFGESTPAGGLFGASPATESKPTLGGLFGAPVPTATPATTAPSTTGLFGATTSAGTSSTPGLFGSTQSTAPSTQGLFGASTPSTSSATTGLFGVPVTQLSAPTVFGNAAASSQTLELSANTGTPAFSFGASTTLPKPADPHNIFGAAGNGLGNGQSTFGSPMKTDNSPAKNAAPMPTPATGGSIFNFSSATPAFGAPTPSSSNIFGGGNSAIDANQSGTTIFGGNNSFSAPTPAPPTVNTSFAFSGGGNNNAGNAFNNPFATGGGGGGGDSHPPSATSSFDFNFGAAPAASQNQNNSFNFGTTNAAPAACGDGGGGNGTFSFSAAEPKIAGRAIAKPRRRAGSPAVTPGKKPFIRAGTPGSSAGGGGMGSSQPSFSFTAPNSQQQPSFSFGQPQPPQQQQQQQQQHQQQQQQQMPSIFANPQSGGPPTSGASPSILFGVPSLGVGNGFGGAVAAGSAFPSTATTPAAAAATPTINTAAASDGDDAEAPLEQINLTTGGPGEENETVLYEVRAKALKFVKDSDNNKDKTKSDNPWSTQGIGPLRLLKNQQTHAVRLLLRAEPSGKVALNRALLPGESYAANEKYVKITTADESGAGLETWMLQVKTKDMAAELARKLEEYKGAS